MHNGDDVSLLHWGNISCGICVESSARLPLRRQKRSTRKATLSLTHYHTEWYQRNPSKHFTIHIVVSKTLSITY